MKFDVIISNPPTKLSDGGNSASASPLYHFVCGAGEKNCLKLYDYDYSSQMVLRWKKLDSFRSAMLNDKHF